MSNAAKELRRWRDKSQLSRSALAKMLGAHEMSVFHWEMRGRRPNADMMARIRDDIGIPVEDWFARPRRVRTRAA